MLGLSNSTGCMASEVVCHEKEVLSKPKEFSFAEAAGFLVGFYTAYHGLVHRGKVEAKSNVMITGAAGGMGTCAIQLAKKLGARVIAVCSTQEKANFCKKVGADDVIVNDATCDIKSEVDRITSGQLVDVCYELVGGDVFKQCIRCMAPNGRLLVVGFASGKIPLVPANLVLIKGFQIVGVRSGAEMILQPQLALDMQHQIAALTLSNRDLAPLILPSSCFHFSDFRSAFDLVRSRSVLSKSIVLWNSPSKL